MFGLYQAAQVWEVIISVLLAFAGGFARMLQVKDLQKLKLVRILSELFISGFAGIMVLLLARSFGLAGDWLGLVSGMAGWLGPRILDLIVEPVGKTIGLEIKTADGQKSLPKK